MKNKIYDLQGRRVGKMNNEELRMKNESHTYSSLTPGLYIIDGQKVFIK